ncbi:sigma-54-dependent Fis family transcriptional regulator [Aliidongia dinghuensis]|uniref:Sigma-54-dependent Fis family transcriptional regulator n=1 Tax=Aliidongia dinghuensis TaxID=1867774 RepID=A0A8J3E402_9PROT|nr:sigma 54-interacting transcriptional regulator [Aliidongia dinghuensis]GGF20057.1 sigma-54-dependent Fis family transcriptional regulator [Aliidongia dinghuensis]
MPSHDPTKASEEFFQDASAIHRRAMQSLFDRLDRLCEGAIAVDRHARVVWVNEKYATLLGLPSAEAPVGRDVEEIIPNSLMRQVVQTGQPILLDIMEFGSQPLVVTRMPLEDEAGRVIGAVGFVLYDRIHALKPMVAKFMQLQNELAEARRRLAAERRPRYSLADYIGNSPAVLEVKRLARRAAQQDATVLLTGETGTGKELLAQAIHGSSLRKDKPFVAVNVAAVPEALLEAEFFGTAPGAYTGADRKGRDGKLKVADGGTLFLDEIGDMPLDVQAKLLRALQEQEIEPLGANKVIRIDVRIIAATHVDLERLVEQGRFRPDLYYRLDVLRIELPPLRLIKPDLEALCETFLDQIAARTGTAVRSISPGGLVALSGHHWPGNMRELRNTMERAAALSDNQLLTEEDFRGILPKQADGAAPPASLPSYDEALALFERTTLSTALAAAGGKAAEAAKLLGMSRANFYKKLAKLGLSQY